MSRIPDEYYALNEAVDLNGEPKFIILMNFGPYKLSDETYDKLK